MSYILLLSSIMLSSVPCVLCVLFLVSLVSVLLYVLGASVVATVWLDLFIVGFDKFGPRLALVC